MAINPVVLQIGDLSMFRSPLLLVSRWHAVGDVLYFDFLDNDPITDPTTEISDPRRQVVSLGNRPASNLWLRMRYLSSAGSVWTVTQSPQVRVFGRASIAGQADEWQYIANSTGDIDVELTAVVASDCVNSTGEFLTTADERTHRFDLQGCNEFLVGVQKELKVSTGSKIVAALEVRFT